MRHFIIIKKLQSSTRLIVQMQPCFSALSSASSPSYNTVSPAPSPPPEGATPSEATASSRGGFGIPVAALLQSISKTPQTKEETPEVEDNNLATRSGSEEAQSVDMNEEVEQDSMEQPVKIVTFIFDTDEKLKKWYI
ncbi:unnamed protein product [Orchesella dallaii]|uniref:Uncharacterized protein n=1 Tax=Orchesella dallaii TaxID=48710 RepID=A0ABP1QHT9_9HEXA